MTLVTPTRSNTCKQLVDTQARLNKRGFSLAEAMVSMVLGTMILMTVLSFQVLGQRTYEMSVKLTEVQGGTRVSIQRITQDLRWAKQLILAQMVNGETCATGNSSLVLEIPSIDGSGNIIDDSTNDYICYRLFPSDQTQLQRIVDADAASSRIDSSQVVAQNIQSLAFSSGGTPLGSIGNLSNVASVEVNLSSSKQVIGTHDADVTIGSAIELRNQ